MIREQQQTLFDFIVFRRLRSSSGLKPQQQQQYSSPFLRQPGVLLGFSIN